MGFIDETASLLGIDKTFNKLTLFASPSLGIVVEGYDKISEFSSEKISLIYSKTCKLSIAGKNLEINEISYRELAIKGQIEAIKF